MMDSSAASQTFSQSLEVARFIKIYVADQATPFLVQQQLLEGVSHYFVKALKHEHLGGTPEPGVLRFPEDDLEAWQPLLQWMFKRTVARCEDDSDASAAIRCWVLGDKYCIPAFQNQNMLALLRFQDVSGLDTEILKAGIRLGPPNSHLRRLMLEDAVTRVDDLALNGEDLADLEGCGCLAELVNMLRDYTGDAPARGVNETGSVIDNHTLQTYMIGGWLEGLEADSVRTET